MDLRWPILGGTVLAAAGAGAGVWMLEGAIGPAAAAGVGVAALGGVALEMALRRKDIAGLRAERKQRKSRPHIADIAVSTGKSLDRRLTHFRVTIFGLIDRGRNKKANTKNEVNNPTAKITL